MIRDYKADVKDEKVDRKRGMFWHLTHDSTSDNKREKQKTPKIGDRYQSPTHGPGELIEVNVERDRYVIDFHRYSVTYSLVQLRTFPTRIMSGKKEHETKQANKAGF